MRNNIEKWQVVLVKASVEGVAEFINKVRSNAKVPENAESLLCEARAALMFREHGFSVRMQDSPDLKLEYHGVTFFAEVKQFRLKSQDMVDETRLLDTGSRVLEKDLSVLVSYGDTQATEEKHAWQQLVDVARSKINQYRINFPNLLVVFSSSSHCVEDADFITAVRVINNDILFRKTPGLEKLSGFLFVTKWINVHPSRQVYFAPLHNSVIPLPRKLWDALSKIRYCRWDP